MKRALIKSQYGAPWSTEELILAFDLYCRIPFQKTKANNSAVIDLANILGRTPASVARKLGNFGAFDPALRKVHIKGLTHTSKLDREIWEKFHSDWNGLVWEAIKLRRSFGGSRREVQGVTAPTGPSEMIRLTKQRAHQAFFRDVVLSSYGETCCITGLAVPECLVASHIVPWSENEQFRTDPTNGLCLSATFDRLFDSGFMTITNNLLVRFSSSLVRSRSAVIQNLLCCYHNQPIRKPYRFLPSVERLEWHQINRFQK